MVKTRVEKGAFQEEEEFWFKKPKDKGNGSKSTTSECLSTPKPLGLIYYSMILMTEKIDELRNYLRIVDFEKSAQDRESLEAISMITEFK
ncbi:hypothetical protein Tco_0023663, partial [Tanacetum coccineum]